MNWQHLQAFLWLRWRLLVNQARRAGAINSILVTIVTAGALLVAVPSSIACFVIGIYAFPEAPAAQLLYIWDGVIVGFLFFWTIGLMTDLQRSEALSLSRFLHLPVSIKGAFLINYLGSLLSLSLILFLPVMLGLGLALIYTKGLRLTTVIFAIAAFLFMVTALTYQFQGWLASLLSNPRRRRAVVAGTMTVFVLIFQLPNLLNVFGVWNLHVGPDESAAITDELTELERRVQSREITPPEYTRRANELVERRRLARQQAESEGAQRLERAFRLANLILPIGWLPLGVMAAAEGNMAPAALGTLGMTLIGAASLRRAYRTTLGLYQGQYTSGTIQQAPRRAVTKTVRKPGDTLLARRVPGLSEPAAAVALASLRSLLRAPEAKMMTVGTFLMAAVFVSAILRQAHLIPVPARPFVAIGALAFVLLVLLQVMANQFGFDRDGFCAYVLSAATRRDILLGKNLSFAPLALAAAAIILACVQVACPLRLDHLLAMVPQLVSMFLLFCLLTNLISIYAPMAIAAGSLKPASPKLASMVLQMAAFTFLFPLTQAPAIVPLAVELLCEWLGWTAGAPVCLLLATVECAAIIVIYRFVLNWQGDLLQAREQKILEVVTKRAA
ncbi:MAG: hypothetical protein ACT4QC_16125 [Planctomycetaceae bacterium]